LLPEPRRQMARPNQFFCRCYRMVHGEPQSSLPDKNSALIALGEEILSALDAGRKRGAVRAVVGSPCLDHAPLAYPQNQIAGENRTNVLCPLRNAEARRLIGFC